MSETGAVRVAIDLIQVPSRVRRLRSRGLPHGISMVLRIAAGDEAAEVEAAEAVGRPRELVRKAAAFFIEQILLCPDTDSYRVLGASRHATADELRRNMALLLRGLHPDVNRQGDRSIFAGRVTKAWEDLKTPERRAAYDKKRRAQKVKSPPRKKDGRRLLFGNHASSRRHSIWREERNGLLRRAVSLLLGGARY